MPWPCGRRAPKRLARAEPTRRARAASIPTSTTSLSSRRRSECALPLQHQREGESFVARVPVCLIPACLAFQSQVSIRANEKLRTLSSHSFKKSHVFWVIERTNLDVIWSCVLPESHVAVKEWRARDKRSYGHENFLDHGDIMQSFLERWERGALEGSPVLPTAAGGKAGAAFPLREDGVDEMWGCMRSARECPALDRALTSPPSLPHHLPHFPARVPTCSCVASAPLAADCSAYQAWVETGDHDLDGMELEEEEELNGEANDGADRGPCAPLPSAVQRVAAAASLGDGAAEAAIEDEINGGVPEQEPDAMPDVEMMAVDAPRAETRPGADANDGGSTEGSMEGPTEVDGGVTEVTCRETLASGTPSGHASGSSCGDSVLASSKDVDEGVGLDNCGAMMSNDETDVGGADALSPSLRTLEQASDVELGDALKVSWGGHKQDSYVGVVHHLSTPAEGQVTALMDWDDGTVDKTLVVLVGPAAVPWTKLDDGSCVMTRFKNSSMMDLFRGRTYEGLVASFSSVPKPVGVFAVTLDAKSLGGRLNSKLRWDEVVWSTRLTTGGPVLPKEFDLVATFTESSVGGIRTPKDIYVVLGYASAIEISQGPRAAVNDMIISPNHMPLKKVPSFH